MASVASNMTVSRLWWPRQPRGIYVYDVATYNIGEDHIGLVNILSSLEWTLDWRELNEENIKRLPPKSPGVYALGDTSKNVIYYGSTGNLEQRLFEQLANPVNACVRSKAKHFKYKKTSSEEEAKELEKKLIDTDNPPCNMQ